MLHIKQTRGGEFNSGSLYRALIGAPPISCQVQAAGDKVKEALKGENAEEIKSSTEALTQTWHQVASELYQPASAEQPPPGAETGPAPGADEQGASSSGEQKEGAVDADFEVVDEEPAEKK